MNSGTRKAPSATVLGTLITDKESAHKVADAVTESFLADEVAISLTEAGNAAWRLAIYCGATPQENALRALTAAAAGPAAGEALTFTGIAATDWVRESLAGLKPVAAGRFIVHGAHDRARVRSNRIGIEIEAALAFGTGHHGTTRGCLLALDRLCKTQGVATGACRILDLGTGSGVLAIAAARRLHRRVLATDIDADSVRLARDNTRLNHVSPLIEVVRATGLTAPAIRARAPFDLIFANILLRPLQRLASSLSKSVASGGHVVLSGLMTSQANAALASYRALTLERRIDLDGWTTLILKRRVRPRRVVARRRRRS